MHFFNGKLRGMWNMHINNAIKIFKTLILSITISFAIVFVLFTWVVPSNALSVTEHCHPEGMIIINGEVRESPYTVCESTPNDWKEN